MLLLLAAVLEMRYGALLAAASCHARCWALAVLLGGLNNLLCGRQSWKFQVSLLAWAVSAAAAAGCAAAAADSGASRPFQRQQRQRQRALPHVPRHVLRLLLQQQWRWLLLSFGLCVCVCVCTVKGQSTKSRRWNSRAHLAIWTPKALRTMPSTPVGAAPSARAAARRQVAVTPLIRYQQLMQQCDNDNITTCIMVQGG